jgi:hypothetical protein
VGVHLGGSLALPPSHLPLPPPPPNTGGPRTHPPRGGVLEAARDAQRRSADGELPQPLLRKILHAVEAVFASPGFLASGFTTSPLSRAEGTQRGEEGRPGV